MVEQLSYNGDWVRMDKWPGMSGEVLDEVITYLRAISRSEIIEWRDMHLTYKEPELANAVLSVSLILKQTYGPVV